MRNFTLMLALCGFALSATGCAGVRNVFYPGSIEQQQSYATLHDPYPDNDAGPEMTGVRPRSFDRPMPEAQRNQYARGYFWGR